MVKLFFLITYLYLDPPYICFTLSMAKPNCCELTDSDRYEKEEKKRSCIMLNNKDDTCICAVLQTHPLETVEVESLLFSGCDWLLEPTAAF